MIEVLKENIVKLPVDVIVNAANERLLKGSGVCGAIHKAAGPELEAECIQIGHCPTGSAVLTKAYGLNARFVIHAVGPKYFEDPKLAPSLLHSTYLSALNLAIEHKAESIAFPCISTGVYGYPKQEAAVIAVSVAREFLKTNRLRVIFCCFEGFDFEIYQRLLV